MEMTTNELKENFKFLDQDSLRTTEWKDGVGFSIFKDYHDGRASLYKIGISDRELQKDDPLKNLRISASYGDNTPDGITLAPRKQSLWDPIDLYSLDEYFYNTATRKFYYHNKEVSAQQIFLNIENEHMRPTKKIRGFLLRYRLWYWRRSLPFTIKVIDSILIFLLWIISGERLKSNIWEKRSELINKRIPEKDIQFEQAKTMDFFGYKAKRWSVVFYCTLHLIIYVIIFNKSVRYGSLSGIFTNNFLAVCYIVVSFAITESFIPTMLKSIINKITPKVFNRVTFKELKI